MKKSDDSQKNERLSIWQLTNIFLTMIRLLLETITMMGFAFLIKGQFRLAFKYLAAPIILVIVIVIVIWLIF